MASISEALIATPTLPARFVSHDYNKFLFFDFSIRNRPEFFEELQGVAGEDSEIQIFYPGALQLLGETVRGEKWSDKIKFLDKKLESENEYLGLIVLERNGGWILVQDSPVNWGVLAFNSASINAFRLFSKIDKDWFLSIDDFKEAIDDPCSEFHESFDMEFMKQLIINYSA